MTVAFGAIGTGANGSTTVAPSYPTGITAGQYLLCVVTSGATNSETPTTPSGWTLLGTGASTDGAFGVDTGPRRATVFGKVADGTESGTLTVSITNGNTCRGTISRFTKTVGGVWDVVGEGANDSTSGTGVSMTTAAIDWATGDCVLVATGQRVDTATLSAQSLTAVGTTFGTRTNRADTAVTTGNDHRHVVDTWAATTTGGGSAATTWAYTASASVSAGGVVVRIREVEQSPAHFKHHNDSSNGQSAAFLGALVGFAGAASIVVNTVHLPSATPPSDEIPVPPSISWNPRHLDQPAPVFSKYPHPVIVVQEEILRPTKVSNQPQEQEQKLSSFNKYFHPSTPHDTTWVFTLPQSVEYRDSVVKKYFFAPVIAQPFPQWKFVRNDPQWVKDHIQPSIWGTEDGARLPAREFTSIPHQHPRQAQPKIQKFFHAPAVAQPTPVWKFISAKEQNSTQQIQSVAFKYPHPEQVQVAQFIRRTYLKQESTEQFQPSIKRKFFQPAANVYTIEPSGSVVFTGAPSLDQTNVIAPSGGVNFSGDSAFSQTKTIVCVGGITVTLTVTQNHTNVIVPSGSVVFSGGAGIVFVPAGGSLNAIISRLNVKISRAMGL